MKTKLFLIVLLFIGCFPSYTYSQDIIVQRNGEEINAKVLEINQNVITYKNWANINGPTYSTAKSEIFMIKYANGTKDVFEANPLNNNNPTSNIVETSANLFIGTWYHKKYNGNSNKTVINISKAMDNYLVESKVHERVDENFYSSDGSFKEVGTLVNGSIVVNSMIKLSLLNENTLLMGSQEFTKTCPVNNNSNSTNNQPNIPASSTAGVVPSYKGAQVNGKKEGNGTQTYPDGSRYEGEWRKDMRYGFGVMYSADGNNYAGYWKNDKRDSTGVNIFPITSTAVLEAKFEGIYKDDVEFNGKITMTDWKGRKKECIVTDGIPGKFVKVKE